MGLRLANGVNSVPVSCKDGVLKYHTFSQEYCVQIPILKNFAFEEQCNHFLAENVCAYLYNDDYVLILRFDGTGCVCTKQLTHLYGSFVWPGFDNGTIYNTSGGFYDKHGFWQNVVLSRMGDSTEYILSTDEAFTFLLKAEDNFSYLEQARLMPESCTIGLVDDKLYVLNGGSKPLYEIKGKLYKSSGNIYLGGMVYDYGTA